MLKKILEEYREECFEHRTTPKDFFVERGKNDKGYRRAMDHMDKFQNIYKAQVDVWGTNEKKVDLQETLEAYISTQNEVDGKECLKIITDAGHFPMLKAVFNTFF